jgi:hypothetical protein
MRKKPSLFNLFSFSLRCCPRCKFLAHMDGPWTPDVDHQSIYTVVFYLNENFTGGMRKER